jgi:hypothetical protein
VTILLTTVCAVSSVLAGIRPNITSANRSVPIPSSEYGRSVDTGQTGSVLAGSHQLCTNVGTCDVSPMITT